MVVWLIPTSAGASHAPSVLIQSLDGTIHFSMPVGDSAGGVSLAFADLGTDAVSEILVGNGLGSEPRVSLYRQDGSLISSFLAYDLILGVGLNITACDLTGDGVNEIVVAPQRGGGPHIRVFNNLGQAIDNGGIFAYAEKMRVGVNLACGNLQGDGRAELVTLPASGGGPHVRVWEWQNGLVQKIEFFAFNASDGHGMTGLIHNKTLSLVQQQTSTPIFKTINLEGEPTTLSENRLALSVTGIQQLILQGDDVFLATTDGVRTMIDELVTGFDAHLSASMATNATHLIFAPMAPRFIGDLSLQRITVDVSDQRLSAYEQGILTNTFLISSGRNNATPLGNHTVLAKLPFVHYKWFYGAGNPRNYDLGVIPYNLRFAPHFYIHYAPWHNNFGHPMSHGCVNVSLTNIKWIYDWAEVDAPVVVQS